MNIPPQQQHQQQQQQQQEQPNNGQGQHYGNLQGSSSGNLSSFAALPPNPYNLNTHLMGLSMQNSSSSAGLSSSSSLAPVPTSSSLMNGGNSGSTTPSMVYASAPSSPNLRNLQYNPSGNAQYNQSSSLYSQPPHQQQHSQYSFHAQQQQPQQQQHSVQSLTSSFYPTSPPHQHQQKSYQQQQQQQAGSSTSFNSMPSAPLRQQPQYAPLVPPLSDAQYAQYHQLLGSAFSSAASTPYHSNQSTPYSSMPTSPTLEYQQLSDPNMIQKPKRRQVKNACGTFYLFVIFFLMWAGICHICVDLVVSLSPVPSSNG
ncbi:hypothetical protein BC939DRAFT_54413 [Gamsiella multidivaricata]|uniref:uncharacterized protein n=1 Tax=Gamsiella multidivaricata TaxID=101098 RepID=UPI00221E8B3E|nr:uncharacterized protein BC939DRAFT_54413 [Gamsiella multidivaricata]KAI7816267.1 hypothetical protein BC939DRAFT_54413 [Gamsiella multidivaricata]